jgi:hypothetical protein
VPWRFHLPHRAGSDEPVAPRTDGPWVEARAVAEADETVRHALSRQTRFVPLPRLVGPMTLTARMADFEASLAGPNGLTPVLRPPTVDRSAQAPGGMVWGLAAPRGREPVEHHPLGKERSAGVHAGAPGPEPAGAGASADPVPPRHLAVVSSPEPAHAYTRVDPDTLPATASRQFAERTRGAGAPAGEEAAGEPPSEATEFGPSPAGVARGARPTRAIATQDEGQDADQRGDRADEPVAIEAAVVTPADHMSLGRTRRLGLGAPLPARPAGTRSLAEPEIPDPLRSAPVAALPPPARPARFAARTPVSGGLPVPLTELHTTPRIAPEAASPARTVPVASEGAPRPPWSAAAPAAEGGRAATSSIQRLPPTASPADRRQPASADLSSGLATGRSSDPTASRTVGARTGPTVLSAHPQSIRPASAPEGDRMPSQSKAASHAGPAAATPPGPPSDAPRLPAGPNRPSLELARPAGPPGVHRAPDVIFGVESGASIQRSPIEGSARAAVSSPATAMEPEGAPLPAWSAPTQPSRATAFPAAPGVTVFRQSAGTAGAAPSGGQAQGDGSLSEDQIDHLAGQVYGRIRNRLEAELLRERERAGILADFR